MQGAARQVADQDVIRHVVRDEFEHLLAGQQLPLHPSALQGRGGQHHVGHCQNANVAPHQHQALLLGPRHKRTAAVEQRMDRQHGDQERAARRPPLAKTQRGPYQERVRQEGQRVTLHPVGIPGIKRNRRGAQEPQRANRHLQAERQGDAGGIPREPSQQKRRHHQTGHGVGQPPLHHRGQHFQPGHLALIRQAYRRAGRRKRRAQQAGEPHQAGDIPHPGHVVPEPDKPLQQELAQHRADGVPHHGGQREETQGETLQKGEERGAQRHHRPKTQPKPQQHRQRNPKGRPHQLETPREKRRLLAQQTAQDIDGRQQDNPSRRAQAPLSLGRGNHALVVLPMPGDTGSVTRNRRVDLPLPPGAPQATPFAARHSFTRLMTSAAFAPVFVIPDHYRHFYPGSRTKTLSRLL